MRIVFDMQAAQSPGSRIRGIGRYSLSLAEAVRREAGDHEVVFALNHGVDDVVDDLRSRLEGGGSRCRVAVWETLPGTQGAALHDAQGRGAAEYLRERFLESLAPDVVHVSSLFEGWGDPLVTSVPAGPSSSLWSATLYDLIPYVRRDVYLDAPGMRAWYMEKLRHLMACDLLLAISEYSRREAIEHLGIDPERIVNVSAACDPAFHRMSPRDIDAYGPDCRDRFGLHGRFVVYTGGFDSRKNVDGLIRAFALMEPEERAGVQLAIVGHGPPHEMDRLHGVVRRVGLSADDVVFTGYVTDEDLRVLYNLCDLYVFPSIHEGFGLPALEAMACGAPVIGANATSLPEVIGLPEALFDPGDDPAMAAAMATGLRSEQFRARLRDHARTQVARFSWDLTARKVIEAMERSQARRLRGLGRERRRIPSEQGYAAIAQDLLDSIGNGPAYAALCRPLARALALNEPPADPGRRLFVDVTMLAEKDVGTGIQRVVRNVVTRLMAEPPPGFAVEPVRFVAGVGYVHAHRFAATLHPERAGRDERPVDPFPGDIVLGLDLIAHLLPEGRDYFRWLRDRGVALWFVVYDLIPVLRPDVFMPGSEEVFRRWYEVVAELATGAVCISHAVSVELREWIGINPPRRNKPLEITHFRLGAELSPVPNDGPGADATRHRRTFLMVGTIEPRKGHAQVLDAFELLWSRGVDTRLVIVGRPGWMVDSLIEKLGRHRGSDGRLLWLEDADDDQLAHWYATASALIMASEAEGFGLPLIEAAWHGLPIISRDLPVFREVAGEGAFYFGGSEAASLADAIARWIDMSEEGRAPSPSGVRWIGWQQSVRELLDAFLGDAGKPSGPGVANTIAS